MLLGEVQISFRDFFRQHKPVIFLAAALSQRLKLFCTEHFSKRVRCVNGAVYENVGNVNALGAKFRIQ